MNSTIKPLEENTKKYFSAQNILVLLCMFLGAADVINRYYYFVFAAFFLFLFVPNRKISLTASHVHLLLLGFFILLFNPNSQTSITNIIRPFTYFFCFLMGCGLFQSETEKNEPIENAEGAVRKAIAIFACGTFLHFILNLLKNRGAINRHVVDFWTNMEMSATGQATLACLAIILAATWLFTETKKVQKVLALLILATAIVYNLILAGRTLFVFIALALLLAFLHRCIAYKKPIFKILFWLFVIFLFLFVIYRMNLFGVRSTIESSNFYDRFFGENNQELNSDKRLLHKQYYIAHFFDHLWGGNYIYAEYGHSAHDLYLDTHNESGVLALIAIISYIIASLSRCVQVVKSKTISFATRQLLLCFYVIINIQFWLEPIMRGMPWLLATYCFIDGMIVFLTKKSTNQNI